MKYAVCVQISSGDRLLGVNCDCIGTLILAATRAERGN